MSRYIDADKLNLYDNLFMSDDTINKSGVYVRYRAVENLIKNAPTADVEEVKHGKWKLNEYYLEEGVCFSTTIECSSCHKEYERGIVTDVQDSDEMFQYCPNCGAKMDLEEES